nr:alpha/beta hydrolase [Heliobacterium chlorum]
MRYIRGVIIPIVALCLWCNLSLAVLANSSTYLASNNKTTSVEKPTEKLLPGEHQVTINGATLTYYVSGKGPVCLAHPGGPGFGGAYLKMPEVEKEFTMVYFDPVGTGNSERLKNLSDYSFSRYVDDMEKLRQYLQLDKFYLLGHSHGGMVAQLYAIQYPNHLNGLILYGTTPTTDDVYKRDVSANLFWFIDRPWFWQALMGLRESTLATTDEQAAQAFQKCVGFYFADYDHHKGEIDPVLKQIHFSLGPNKGFYQNMGIFDTRDRLSLIGVPTLILAGVKDFVCPVKYAEEMQQRIPRSKLVLFQSSGHMAHFEEPVKFAKAIGDFLTAITRNRF